MSATWICSKCGGNSNHFSTSKSALVCDSCGTEIRTDTERQEELNYQRNMALAKNHLKVGNWEDAKRIVKPYENSRPADKRVYLYLLVATTKCFEDFLLDNPSTSQEVDVYWDKLRRLGCINSAMVNYFDRRAAKLREIKEEYTIKKVLLIVISIVLTFIAFSLIVCGEVSGVLFVALAIVGWVHSTKWINKKL